MSLDSILRATGKNLANCGKKSDWYSGLVDLSNLSVSEGTVSLPAVLYGTGMALNKNRISTNGETFTFHSNLTAQTAGDVTYCYIIKPYKNDAVIENITLDGWTYNQYYHAYWTDTSKSFTLPKDTVDSFEWGFSFYATGDISNGTVLTYSNIQIEKGSTATTYEPYEYLGPKTIIIPYRGNNIITYPYENTSQTINGVTFTDNGDGTITANGTADSDAVFWLFNSTKTVSQWGLDSTKNYFFRNLRVSGKDDSGSTMFYAAIQYRMQMLMDTGEGVTLEKPNAQYPLSFKIVVLSGKTVNNVTFYPQLLEKTENNVYEEYSANTGNKEVLKVSYNNKNLLPYPYFHSSMTNQAGIAYTVNSDGTITANGTATGRSEFVLSVNKTNWMSGNYTLSGCPAGGSKDTYSIITINGFSDIGSGITIPQSELTRISIIIKQGTTVDNLVFKPQLELGDKKTDYVPYKQEVIWTKPTN